MLKLKIRATYQSVNNISHQQSILLHLKFITINILIACEISSVIWSTD